MMRRISWRELAAEPFRLFFPAAILAAVLGVASWPLHFAGLLANYPGGSHARLMTHGFFGGLILGFPIGRSSLHPPARPRQAGLPAPALPPRPGSW